jgi:hypothetical protein
MSFFSTILDKLGLGKKEEPPAPPPIPTAPPPVTVKPVTPAPVVTPPPPAAPGPAPKPVAVSPIEFGPPKPVTPAVKPVSEVDVVKKLEKLSEGSGLDWKVSIVDLLKLLEIDSSREARKALAVELGCPADLMGDSAKMNVWLHKTVLKKIAENGGNIPKSMLD